MITPATRDDLLGAVKQLEDHIHKIPTKQANGYMRTCYDCVYCDKEAGKCSLYDTVPPMKIIVHGCDKWELDFPF